MKTALELTTMGGIQIGSILDQDPGGLNPKMLGMKSCHKKMAHAARQVLLALQTLELASHSFEPAGGLAPIEEVAVALAPPTPPLHTSLHWQF